MINITLYFINQPVTSYLSVITSHPYYWEVTDEMYDVSGVYSYTYYSGAANGCDSTIQLTLTIETGDTTSIGDFDVSNAVINLYPNPTSDDINIQVEGNVTITDIAIFDMYGKLVKIEKSTGSLTNISLKTYAQGVYLLRLLNNNELIKTYKVIKQ